MERQAGGLCAVILPLSIFRVGSAESGGQEGRSR